MSRNSPFCRVPLDWLADPSQCWFDWQTLITGALASFAAWITIRHIRKQIEQSAEHRQDDINRRRNAAKVALPFALSSVNAVVNRVAHSILDEFDRFNPDGSLTLESLLAEDTDHMLPLIEMPSEVVSAFQDFVESLSETDEIQHVAELASGAQILLSRYRGVQDARNLRVDDMFSLIIDAAKVSVLNNSLYQFARCKAGCEFAVVGIISNEDCWDRISQEAVGFSIKRKNFDYICEHVARNLEPFKENGISPWVSERNR